MLSRPSPRPALRCSLSRLLHSRKLAAQLACADPAAAGTLVGTLPLSRAGAPVQPYGVKFGGRGLDARLITDLSRLEPDHLITPNSQAFVRTECPPVVAQHRGPWRIRTSGLLAREGSLTADELRKSARPMGAHLCECSGNNNPANFGLMSVAEWDGVPLTEVLSRLELAATATAVLVGGVDPDTPRSSSSTAGASWVIPFAHARSPRRLLRGAHERRAAVARSRAAGPAHRSRLVRLCLDQVGRRGTPGRCERAGNEPDEGVRGPHPPDGSA